jgi:ComF family protein
MVWATRCVICDRPGALLCASCRSHLPYIDRWQACPRCGAPAGRIICTECNHFTLQERGLASLPYNRCTSVMVHDERTRRIITSYKDAGEQRLSALVADFCADTVSPSVGADGYVVSYIPSSRKAVTRRGFDHAQITARQLASRLGVPLRELFERPCAKDQRKLNREQRQENMRASLRLKADIANAAPPRVLLYDDVYTTGATLCAASEALRDAGCKSIRCVTFLRVS